MFRDIPSPLAMMKYVQSGGYEKEMSTRRIMDPVFHELIASGFVVSVTSYGTGGISIVDRHIDDMMISVSAVNDMPVYLVARKWSERADCDGHTAHSVYMDAKKILDKHQIVYRTNVNAGGLSCGRLELIHMDDVG